MFADALALGDAGAVPDPEILYRHESFVGIDGVTTGRAQLAPPPECPVLWRYGQVSRMNTPV